MDDQYLTTKALAVLQIKPQKFQVLYESGHYAKVIFIFIIVSLIQIPKQNIRQNEFRKYFLREIEIFLLPYKNNNIRLILRSLKCSKLL